MVIMSKCAGALRRYRGVEGIIRPWVMAIEDKSHRVAVAAGLSYIKMFISDIGEYAQLVQNHLDNPNDKELYDRVELCTRMLLSEAIVEAN